MKTNKSQGVLFMLETLLRVGSLKKSEVMVTLDINDLTFRRYISEIRCYFVNYNRDESVEYDKQSDLYRLRR